MADAITQTAAHLPAHSPHIVRVWFVVDATVDTRTGRPATRSAEHAGWEGGRRGDTTPGTGPNPPRTSRERRAHTDGTLHPPRQ